MPETKARPSLLHVVWRTIIRIMATGVVCSFYRVRMFGASNVPSKGPVLIICNHQSFLDPMFTQAWIRRGFHFVARDSLYNNRFFGLLIKFLYTVPIKRSQADIAAMKTIIEKLRQDCAVCLYPEATRTYDGRIADIKPGFALLARKSGAKVLPVVIDGAFECWPRHKKFPGPGKVAVSFGPPIAPQEIERLGDRHFAEVLTEEMRKMQNEIRRRIGRHPFDYSVQQEQK